MLKNSKGQSTIEYILLLSVVMILTIKIMTGPIFKNLFGQESIVFASILKKMEFSYKHGFFDSSFDNEPINDYGNYTLPTHPSYSIPCLYPPMLSMVKLVG